MSGAAAVLPILVAEDNAISRELIVLQLGLLGHAAVACEDGAEALAAWRTGRFAMLLTDLQMPGLDGFALAAAIRREAAGARLPIVALTAAEGGIDADADPDADLTSTGIDDTLCKPVSLDTLRRALARWGASAPATPSPHEESTPS